MLYWLVLASIVITLLIAPSKGTHLRHQRRNHSHNRHTNRTPNATTKIPSTTAQRIVLKAIGETCINDSKCANSSNCASKVFEEIMLKLKVCICDLHLMNRVDHSCLVKPGHKCYCPEKDPHGRHLHSCMKGMSCKSGINQSDLHGGYCMCPDRYQDEPDPHRYLNQEYEMHRCCGTALVISNLQFYLLLVLCISWFSKNVIIVSSNLF
jgi:hypothetical protein